MSIKHVQSIVEATEYLMIMLTPPFPPYPPAFFPFSVRHFPASNIICVRSFLSPQGIFIAVPKKPTDDAKHRRQKAVDKESICQFKWRMIESKIQISFPAHEYIQLSLIVGLCACVYALQPTLAAVEEDPHCRWMDYYWISSLSGI